jgi:hypothetical protein
MIAAHVISVKQWQFAEEKSAASIMQDKRGKGVQEFSPKDSR